MNAKISSNAAFFTIIVFISITTPDLHATETSNLTSDASVKVNPDVLHLDQNWSHDERHAYQTMSDGGELTPYKWLVSLEKLTSVLSDPALGLLQNE